MLIGIQDEIQLLAQSGLLEPLLKDQTMGRNLLWATEAYTDLGCGFARDEEITQENSCVIRNRAIKALEQQFDRTKSHAEVFSPIWVCNKMIDAALEEDAINAQAACHHTAQVEADEDPQNEATVQTTDQKTCAIESFLQSRWLEITCGEAPFLVQRYDVLTGEIIPIEQRRGILDRKLQSINSAETSPKKDIFKSILHAFQSVYGYELQGDNLLIARLNLYKTFEEYLEYFFHRKPTSKESLQIIEIITWNLWQMDGLTGCTPDFEEPASPKVFLFDVTTKAHKPRETPKPCQIRVYCSSKQNHTFTIPQLVAKGKGTMKFDYIVGNPPYQEETVESVSSMNGQVSVKNVFHLFQKNVDLIVNKITVLIYPSKRWLHRSGKGMNEFGLSQINSTKLSKIINYPNAKEVFKDSSINDGVGIVVKNQNKTEGGFVYEYHKGEKLESRYFKNPGEDLLILNPEDYNICTQIAIIGKKLGVKYLDERILPRSLFGIESHFVQQNPSLVKPFDVNSKIDYSTEIKLLTNDKAGSAGRTKCYVTDRCVIKNNQQYIDQWQVVAISANPGGQRRDSQLEIIDNHTAFGRSKVALGSFKSEREAQNFYAYLKTYLVRFMFLMTDENLTSLGKKVPDFMDYTQNNKYIDFSKDLNEQLFKLFELSNDEINYIKTTIDEIKKKRGEVN